MEATENDVATYMWPADRHFHTLGLSITSVSAKITVNYKHFYSCPQMTLSS